MQEILKEHHISVQRYWNATIVGPDVRRFLAAYVAIPEALAAKNLHRKEHQRRQNSLQPTAVCLNNFK